MEENKKQTTTESNKIILAGAITRINRTQKVVKIHVSTSPSRLKKYRSHPEIVFFGPLIEKTADLKPNDHIEVVCAVQSVPYSKRRGEGNLAYFVASDVKKSKSLLSEHLGTANTGNTGNSFDDKNEGVIAGEVVNVFVTDKGKGVILSIRARANGRVSLPTVACFDNVSAQIQREQVKKGDVVAVSCIVNTGTDKKGVYHESLVAREFSLIERK